MTIPFSQAGMMRIGSSAGSAGVRSVKRPLVGQVIGLIALCLLAALGAGQLRKHAPSWGYSIQPSFHGAADWSWPKAMIGGIGFWALIVVLGTLLAATYVKDTPTRVGIGFFAGSFAFGNLPWLLLFAIGDGSLPHTVATWPTWLLAWGLDALFLVISAVVAALIAGRPVVGIVVSVASALIFWLTYFAGEHGHQSIVLKGVQGLGLLWPHLVVVLIVAIGASLMLKTAAPLPPPYTITGGYAAVQYPPDPYQPPVPSAPYAQPTPATR
jgi:hypothetical protein